MRRTPGQGLLLGVFLFLVQNTAVWSAWLRTPAGAVPVFHLINPDTCQYLGFLALRAIISCSRICKHLGSPNRPC